MILAFDFNYVSHNGILENLLKEIASDFGILHKILRKDSIVTLYVEDKEERLGSFADALSANLPLSVFFKSSSVEVVDVIPFEDETLPPMAYTVEFTPKILNTVSDKASPLYLSPFADKPNVLCELKEEGKTLLQANDSASYEHFYRQIADIIANGENVSIPTKHGLYVIGALEKLPHNAFEDTMEIIVTDLSAVERMVVCRENELKALASLERPAIRFKINALYAQKNILTTARVWLRLADDLLMYHLCKVLSEKGILYLYRVQKSSSRYSVHLNTALKPLEDLSISVLENGTIFVLKGSDYASSTLKESLKKFDEPSHAAYASLMQEHHLFDATSSCFYLSQKFDDRLMHYSKEHGMLNLVSIRLPNSFEELFAEIARSSPSAERLLANYKEQFPEVYAKALSIRIPENLPKSIYSLWKIAAVVLGLCDSLEQGADMLIENAEDYGGQKGPRIDYYLEKEDALSADLDYVRLIRSAMSYKIAGTDNPTLSFGFMESLAFFLSDTADAHRENLATSHIGLSGSLFGYKRLSEMVLKNLKTNHTLCFNKELPIDQ